MVKPTFKVDGMHYDTWLQAFIVAQRLYERYDRARTITVYMIDHHGEETPDWVFGAESQTEEDDDQLDMFS